MEIHECEQRSEEWHALRIGRVTGTKIKEMVTARAPGFETLCRKVAAEKITGVSCEKEFRISEAMQWGIDTEDEARREYEIETMASVREVGFISTGDLWGCSPDGLVGKSGMVEIKCPLAHTHLGYLCNPGLLSKSYEWQIYGQMWVYGATWVDIVSYCPSFQEGKRLLIEKVIRDSEKTMKIELAAQKLSSRVDELMEMAK